MNLQKRLMKNEALNLGKKVITHQLMSTGPTGFLSKVMVYIEHHPSLLYKLRCQ